MKIRKPVSVLAVECAVVIVVTLIPVYFIQPFKAQSQGTIAISYLLRKLSPFITSILLLGGFWICIRAWKHQNMARRAASVLLMILMGTATWFSFQNHFQWLFQPLKDPGFTTLNQTNFTSSKDFVLAVSYNGDSAAYPVRLLAYHHLVHDRVGGKPLIATY